MSDGMVMVTAVPGWLVVSFAAVFGAVFGSFASVPIYRWPRAATVTQPRRSACPACDATVAGRDNVPVVSWLALRGRCRECGAAIHWRYPLLEVVMAGLFVAVTAVHGLTWLLPALLVFSWALVVASAIDLEHRIIPNKLTYRLAPVLLVLVAIAAAATGAWGDLRRAVIAGIALPVAMLALSELFRLLRGQAGIGLGDIKLAASIGLVVGYLGGWELVIFGYASVIGALVVAFTLIATGRAKLATRIPYGPYLALGSLVAVVAGGPLTTWIRGLLGL